MNPNSQNKTISVVVTDGCDQHSRAYNPADVKKIVDDLQQSEDNIVAAMGISDGHTNFEAVFTAMGLRDRWILTPANSPSEIRRSFGMMSQSASAAAQGTAALGGGFGA